jgi:DNA-binding beta-propeller fold protein YncE
VDVSGAPRVERTLLVGDEPRDIVFAANGRAFITTAHRGQHRTHPSIAGVPGAGDPQLTTPGVPRADVWVFDPANLDQSVGGTPLRIVQLFGDTPRALAVSADGQTVYAAIFHSGNQTAPVEAGVVCENEFRPDASCVVSGVTYPGGDFGPSTNHAGAPAPHVSLIAKYDNGSGKWRDLIGRDWSNAVRFNLPDKDVFAIDAGSLAELTHYRHVGTTLFNMAVNPATGAVYVSNTDSQNHERFEGAGRFAGRTVQGNLAHARITVLKGGQVLPRHLNKHIDYAVRPAPASAKQHSLATPLEMQVSGDGSKLYVAAFGSSRVGVYDTAALEAGSFDPAALSAGHIRVNGGGPAGLVLNDSKGKLYVFTRFDNAISVVDTASRTEVAHLAMHNPEPAKVVQGRALLYDAVYTSANGEASCASCHIFGDKDELSWDLGDPDGNVTTTPYDVLMREAMMNLELLDEELESLKPVHLNGTGKLEDLHPMKGPMSSQTLRGMQFGGAMHWRGDRADGFFGRDSRRNAPDARLSFKNFIVAYQGLLGRSGMIDAADMDRFADFAFELLLPPNPVRNLDNSLTPAQHRGMRFFMGCVGADSLLYMPASCGSDNRPRGTGHFSDGFYLLGIGQRCEGCHTLEPQNGFFGTDGSMSLTLLPQISKVPHLRNVYTKVGMFGGPAHRHQNPFENEHKGDQVRGFGVLSSGSVDTMFRFFNGKVFNRRGPFGAVGFSASTPAEQQTQRREVEQFVLAYPSDLAPIVGQQVTLRADNAAAAGPRIDLLIQRARAAFTSKILGSGVTECDLVASAAIQGAQRRWLYRPRESNFEPNDGSARISDASLRQLASTAGQAVTYTCVPPGSGVRVALDRDRDTFMDGVDVCEDDRGCSYLCGDGRLDCNQDADCQEFTGSNESHRSAGRATRKQDCFLIFCSEPEYFAKGSGQALGRRDQTTTLHTDDGGATFATGRCDMGLACETDGNSDVNNCGGCGIRCEYESAGSSCNSGVCQMSACRSGFFDCNGSAQDGCEAALASDVNNCGACGVACSYKNASSACAQGACRMTACSDGYADCNGNPADGCEADLETDRAHCGGCGQTCSFANAGHDCLAGACTRGLCLPGFSDCDGNPANGCETAASSCQ